MSGLFWSPAAAAAAKKLSDAFFQFVQQIRILSQKRSTFSLFFEVVGTSLADSRSADKTNSSPETIEKLNKWAEL